MGVTLSLRVEENGTLRFCFACQKINAVTKKYFYPAPCMDGCVESFARAAGFSTSDANSEYWQIKIKEFDRDKTTFTSHQELYHFIRLPFGLRNAP